MKKTKMAERLENRLADHLQDVVAGALVREVARLVRRLPDSVGRHFERNTYHPREVADSILIESFSDVTAADFKLAETTVMPMLEGIREEVRSIAAMLEATNVAELVAAIDVADADRLAEIVDNLEHLRAEPQAA